MTHNKHPQNNLNIPGNPNSTKLSTAKNTEEMGYRKRVFAFTQAKSGYVLSSASKEHIQAAVKETEIITFCGIKSTHTDYLGSYPSTRRPSDPQFPCAEHLPALSHRVHEQSPRACSSLAQTQPASPAVLPPHTLCPTKPALWDSPIYCRKVSPLLFHQPETLIFRKQDSFSWF